jgi:hypothetical protein
VSTVPGTGQKQGLRTLANELPVEGRVHERMRLVH